MPTIYDVVAYILQKRGQITAIKLQKLVYYSQAWSLVWDEKPLFQEEFQAWDNGPVAPALYAEHQGLFMVTSCPKGNPDKLTTQERETVDAVLGFYGDKSAQWLCDLTRQEQPWKNAHISKDVISFADMAQYYTSISSP